jgi:hypothetical protein
VYGLAQSGVMQAPQLDLPRSHSDSGRGGVLGASDADLFGDLADLAVEMAGGLRGLAALGVRGAVRGGRGPEVVETGAGETLRVRQGVRVSQAIRGPLIMALRVQNAFFNVLVFGGLPFSHLCVWRSET